MSSDAHDRMMDAFQNYFKWHDYFEYHGADSAGIKARHWLSEIRNQASDRRDEIQKERKIRRKLRKGKNGRPSKIINYNDTEE